MYKQSLIKTVKDHIKPAILKRNNRYKKWEYGYNAEFDVVIISKDGTIGEVVEIQNLKVALPLVSKETHKRSDEIKEQVWAKLEYPKELSKIKSVFDWDKYPTDFKEEWYGYIDKEFERREKGFWFYNNGKPTYITGTHYMYLQWSKIDVMFTCP